MNWVWWVLALWAAWCVGFVAGSWWWAMRRDETLNS